MNKGKRYSVPVTAIIIFIILTFSACSPAQKSENTGAQGDAVSSAVEPEAEKTDGETVDTLEEVRMCRPCLLFRAAPAR